MTTVDSSWMTPNFHLRYVLVFGRGIAIALLNPDPETPRILSLTLDFDPGMES